MAPRRGKNIVICLDGTGNQFKEENTNVVKLFRILERNPKSQIAYYNPGVGTLADPAYVTPMAKKINKWFGLGFGRGLTRNLEQAYSYLMEQYEDNDRIFIFGFSRGAYTARALAGFIHACGLLDKGCQNLIPYAMKLYKSRKVDFAIMAKFKSTYGRPCDIHFLGLWDSVSTFGWIYDPVFLPYTTNNKSVQAVRHALAIDERRAFFQPLHWGTDQQTQQDVKEVWFAGVHSDVGGGYPERESGLAKLALQWMIEEASADSFGLKINTKAYQRYVLGDDNKKLYIGPDALAKAHESLTTVWQLVQFLPRRVWLTSEKREALRMPMPYRTIPEGARLHSSVITKMSSGHYQPVNLPKLNDAEFRNKYIVEGEAENTGN